jgi:ribosomal protein S12 methylthiotransferase
VLIEGYHPESNLLMCGRFYGQCPEIDGQVIINDGRLVTEFGKVYPVEITQVADYDLIGRVIGPALEKPEKKKNKTSRPLSLV